jgi:hypothetical protein
VQRIEHEMGVLPLSMRAWYELFDSVNFTQQESQRFAPGTSPVCGLGENTLLIVNSPHEALEGWLSSVREFWDPSEATLRFWESVGGKPQEPEMFFRTGGDNTSGDPMGIILPEPRADGLVDDGCRDVAFVALIRRCFQWGGFPICENYLDGKQPLFGLARPDVERLLPLLRSDLLPV